MLKATTSTTPTPPKHIGTIVEMDSNYPLFFPLKLIHFIQMQIQYYIYLPKILVSVKVEYSSAAESIQISIISNLPNRLSKLCVGDEVDLEG